MALSDEELDKRIEDQEYMGIKGSVLIKHYPYLLDYPPGKRIKKMYDLAMHEHRAYFLTKSLGFEPTEYSLVFRENERGAAPGERGSYFDQNRPEGRGETRHRTWQLT